MFVSEEAEWAGGNGGGSDDSPDGGECEFGLYVWAAAHGRCCDELQGMVGGGRAAVYRSPLTVIAAEEVAASVG